MSDPASTQGGGNSGKSGRMAPCAMWSKDPSSYSFFKDKATFLLCNAQAVLVANRRYGPAHRALNPALLLGLI